MDINKIFGTFGSSSKGDDEFPQISFMTTYRKVDSENHPRYFIKLFQKLILSYPGYSNKIIDLFAGSDIGIDAQDMKRAGESILCDRAYGYLTQIDLQDEYHIRILFQEADEDLEKALNKILSYYENKEEYEKCAKIKKYLDFLNFSS